MCNLFDLITGFYNTPPTAQMVEVSASKPSDNKNIPSHKLKGVLIIRNPYTPKLPAGCYTPATFITGII